MAAAAFARTAAARISTKRYSSFRAASGRAFDLQSYMLSKSLQVNQALESALYSNKDYWHPAATKLHDAMRYSLLNARSKRVCSIACLAASELVGDGDPDQSTAMPAACSLEMLHTMAIIHDDLPCMDNAQLRRGKPACHRAFGDDLALLAGDALLAMAFEHLASASSSLPAAQLLKVAAEMAKAAGWKGMAAGQAVDLASANDPDVTLATVEFVHVHKTSKLLQASLVCGAILGGAADEQVEALRSCGLHAGLMYQIVDDILDVTRSSEQLGKMAGSDLACGKATYPRLVGLGESRLLVQRLQRDAKEQLAGFDEEKATPLLHFVDFIASRQR